MLLSIENFLRSFCSCPEASENLKLQREIAIELAPLDKAPFKSENKERLLSRSLFSTKEYWILNPRLLSRGFKLLGGSYFHFLTTDVVRL